MFSGVNDPYGNDQHPFLIWNMYRINADGSIEQIGRSGVKHAFLTINAGCLDSCNNFDSLGRGCGDTYGSGNNDSPGDMGPRSEIVPATGMWGRCGSIWDSTCTGTQHSNGNNSWTQRMQVHESKIDPAANPGATYMFESWYIARDDINIYNSMATITGTPHYASNQWSLSAQPNYKLGPAIDRWVSPTAPAANSMNTEIAQQRRPRQGRGEGDRSRQRQLAIRLRGREPRLRARGRSQARRARPRSARRQQQGLRQLQRADSGRRHGQRNAFRNGTRSTVRHWTASRGLELGDMDRRRAGPTLDWGSMYTFSITVNASPAAPGQPQADPRGNGAVTLHVATSGSPAAYVVRSLVPTAL